MRYVVFPKCFKTLGGDRCIWANWGYVERFSFLVSSLDLHVSFHILSFSLKAEGWFVSGSISGRPPAESDSSSLEVIWVKLTAKMFICPFLCLCQIISNSSGDSEYFSLYANSVPSGLEKPYSQVKCWLNLHSEAVSLNNMLTKSLKCMCSLKTKERLILQMETDEEGGASFPPFTNLKSSFNSLSLELPFSFCSFFLFFFLTQICTQPSQDVYVKPLFITALLCRSRAFCLPSRMRKR